MKFLNNLSKTIPTQKTADILQMLMSLVFFVVNKGTKKAKKLTQIVKIEEVKFIFFERLDEFQ